jgi:hypothetical protein
VSTIHLPADVNAEFAESKTHRPNPLQQVQYALKRLTTQQGAAAGK